MMPKLERPRIDYTPGKAALDSIKVAHRLFPHLRQQEIIDRLVITGLYALKQPPWSPPVLWGTDRDAWRLPPGIEAPPDPDSR